MIIAMIKLDMAMLLSVGVGTELLNYSQVGQLYS